MSHILVCDRWESTDDVSSVVINEEMIHATLHHHLRHKKLARTIETISFSFYFLAKRVKFSRLFFHSSKFMDFGSKYIYKYDVSSDESVSEDEDEILQISTRAQPESLTIRYSTLITYSIHD